MGKMKFDSEKKVKHPFTVPDGYFARFSEELTGQLPGKAPFVGRKITMWERISPWVYLAAMFVGMALLFKYVVMPADSGIESLSAQEVCRRDHSVIKKALSDMSEDEYFEIMEDHAASVSYHQTLLTDSNY